VDALSAILLVLSEGRFTFLQRSDTPDGDDEMAVDIDHLAARVASLPSQRRQLTASLAPEAVPHRASFSDPGDHPREFVLHLGAVHTMLAVDGKRSVQDLAQSKPSALVLSDLVALMEVGLIDFSSAKSALPQPVG
jgi:hypothetical protein